MISKVPTTRDEVVEVLARSLLVNNLGYLVGAGLAHDLTRSTLAPAPNWKQLLVRMADSFKVPSTDDKLFRPGTSMPQVASKICEEIARGTPATASSGSPKENYEVAANKLKREIANACYFTRHPVRDIAYRGAFLKARPAWIVTTNYDVLLEELIPESVPLIPGQALLAPSHSIPIYHLHGHRINPETIVITEEDYVQLFRPGEYRLLKLSLLFSESVTLALGYGLGDVNVLTALNWSQQYHDGRIRAPEECGVLIQALWDPDHASDPPYMGRNGEIIIPIDNIAGFLDLVGTKFQLLSAQRIHAAAAANATLKTPTAVDTFAKDVGFRQASIQLLYDYSLLGGFSEVLLFLDTALDRIWTAARENDGWTHYETFGQTLIELAERWGDSAHPAMVGVIARRVSNLAPWITPLGTRDRGQAWHASDYWRDNRNRIPATVCTQLLRYAAETGDYSTKEILE